VKYLPVDQPDLAGLLEILKAAEAGAYAVGSFSPRYTPVIAPVLRAGKKQRSPLIVQISQIRWSAAVSPRMSSLVNSTGR
jgi:fructose/tagatose bisphosphate aldolase